MKPQPRVLSQLRPGQPDSQQSLSQRAGWGAGPGAPSLRHSISFRRARIGPDPQGARPRKELLSCVSTRPGIGLTPSWLSDAGAVKAGHRVQAGRGGFRRPPDLDSCRGRKGKPVSEARAHRGTGIPKAHTGWGCGLERKLVETEEATTRTT